MSTEPLDKAWEDVALSLASWATVEVETAREIADGYRATLDAARAAQDVAGRERPSVTWKGADRTAIVLMAPVVDGLCSGCGTKPTRETGSCRCLFRVDEAIRQPVTPPPDALREAISRLAVGDSEYPLSRVLALATPPPDALREAAEQRFLALMHENVHVASRRTRAEFYELSDGACLDIYRLALRAQGVVQSRETLGPRALGEMADDYDRLTAYAFNVKYGNDWLDLYGVQLADEFERRRALTPVDESRDPAGRA